MLIDVLLIAIAYLLGSLTSAVLVCRLLGLPDPRGVGSGNPGATNVLRHGGKKAAILTLVFDVLKGVIAVLIARLVGVDALILALVTLAAFLGHLYPVFFSFRGGKGVATALGCLLALAWQVGLAALATWLVTAFAFRYSSLAALSAAALTPLWMFLLIGEPAFIVMSVAMSALLFWRHRSNIQKLLNGQEDQIGSKKEA